MKLTREGGEAAFGMLFDGREGEGQEDVKEKRGGRREYSNARALSEVVARPGCQGDSLQRRPVV
jgi:hypothetical protein